MRSAGTPSTKAARAQFALIVVFCLASASKAQSAPQTSATSTSEEAGTSTDLFVMLGSDFVRPGLAAKANYNIGIGPHLRVFEEGPYRRRAYVCVYV